VPLAFAQAKNGDKQFWKLEFHMANQKAQHALMRGPVLFFRGEEGRIILVFFLVPNVFLSCSNGVSHVLSLFLKMFSIEPQIYPIRFAQILILMCINRNGELLGAHLFLFCELGFKAKEVLLLRRVPNFPKCLGRDSKYCLTF
jgi:hypothetical protein